MAVATHNRLTVWVFQKRVRVTQHRGGHTLTVIQPCPNGENGERRSALLNFVMPAGKMRCS